MAELALDFASQAEDAVATYEDLAEIEMQMEDVDTEIMSNQEHLSLPIYARRAALVAKIPHFWPLVFEQAPSEIDTFIQPSDSHVFASSLLSFHCSRFEVPSTFDAGFGEPRSLSFKFEFAENEWFADKVLEKKFYYRRAKNGWTGRVSDPVAIKWKKGKDLTEGLLDGALRLWEAEKKAGVEASGKANGKGKTTGKAVPEQEALRKKVDASMEGSQSFFTWFGYRGPRVSAEESATATAKFNSKRQNTIKAQGTPMQDAEADDTAEENLFSEDADTEIFPAGEELAIALAEDLWPAALKYFTTAQEEDSETEDESHDGSDIEDVSVDDENDIVDIRSLVKDSQRSDSGNGAPPSKRRKN